MPGAKVDRKTMTFRGDAAVPPPFRSLPSDYTRSGYARGHLAPAASHSYNELDTFETFLLSTNVVPQNSAMNSGDWLKLERLSRTLCQHFAQVRTVTGPLYLPRVDPATGKAMICYEVVGKNAVAVPTHLFKVIYVEDPMSPEAQRALSNVLSPGILRHMNKVAVPAAAHGATQLAAGGGARALLPAPTSPVASMGTALVPAAGTSISGAISKGGAVGTRQVYIAAFVMPNTDQGVDKGLASYMVPLGELEKSSGLCLTPRTLASSVTMTTVEQ